MKVHESPADFAETLDRLLGAITARDLTVFATIDHAAGAREAGLELEGETVVLFGDPRAGTPLMQDDARIGIELPLRLLVWARRGTAFVGHLDMAEVGGAYDVPEQARRLTAMTVLLDALATEATAPRA
jgi:uncharacterized protein (DUF302 family)